MLAANFKSAAELCVTTTTHRALVELLGELEGGVIKADEFTMVTFARINPDDHTKIQKCICGWASQKGGNDLPRSITSPPHYYDGRYTIEHAKHALRTYLVTGTPDWGLTDPVRV